MFVRLYECEVLCSRQVSSIVLCSCVLMFYDVLLWVMRWMIFLRLWLMSIVLFCVSRLWSLVQIGVWSFLCVRLMKQVVLFFLVVCMFSLWGVFYGLISVMRIFEFVFFRYVFYCFVVLMLIVGLSLLSEVFVVLVFIFFSSEKKLSL